ncbi:ExeM/NucH family extracellular endonuclease [Deinococcus taeanensis]|uniref:ExeM/NucH family extracellular endonuclease n=1 Tax=Deinococcus taeanensis TaxID=2737050 RepID=UPI001CDBE0A2|nr:ExeM/NucH family extracellular endonuclease [Deinococcus taeanensis]UBV43185.1 ExeM/NucH family extracellular endonuclease [Deinococcus taeanensis]
MKPINALLLGGLLTLSACSAPTARAPTPGTAPTARTALGLYELSINGLTGPAAQATVQRYGAGLNTQASEIPTEQLSFVRTNLVNLVDRETRTVHMSATFRVTNNTGAPITVPTFVPVDTDGQNATDGTTPFSQVRTRTGAPTTATGMKVEAAYQSSGGVIQPDPGATPLKTDLNTGGLQLSAPAGTTVPGIAHQGWQTAPLENGQSQLVTFAASVPLQGDDISDADPFSFKLVFAVADNPGTLPLTNIASVQGATPSGDAASPKSGQTVTVEGVVTSVHTANVTGSLKGFFVQEEGIDADDASTTSDGIFVYCNTTCPALNPGDRVQVAGTVSEFTTTTQITSSSVTTLTSSVPLPAAQPLTLPLPVSSRERYEGMRVSASGVVTNNFTLGRGASFDIAPQRIMNFTQLNAPNTAAYTAFKADVPNQYIRIDDGTRAQNPDPEIFARAGQPLSASNTLRGGDTVTATGVLTYSNDGWTGSGSLDTYRIHATQVNVSVTDTNPRLAAPEAVGGALRVGSMNVLNYFTTLLTSNDGCTTNGTSSSARGANNCEEFLRQQTKIIKAIAGLNPDVLGLLEIQNDFDKGTNSSVANLVNALNTEVGAGTFAYINPGTKIGTDVISVAMIYKPAVVDPVGKLAILDNSFDPNYADTCNRPTWAHTFQSKANGGRITAVMMHLKSKGSACAATNDAQSTASDDGQGNGYIARRNAATALVNWLATNPTGVTEDDRLLMGDYNAYAMEEPLSILAAGGYQNLFDKNVYSYQFDGQWGSLDQATGSASLAAQVAGRTKWHINSDEPTVLDYNKEFKSAGQLSSYYNADPFRSSDHDPILIGLNLTAQEPLPVGVQPSISLTPASTTVSVTAGQSSSTTVNVNRTSFSGNVTLGSSVSGAGTPPVITVTSQPGTGTSGTLSVDASSATAGTYTVTVTGSGSGVSDAQTTFTVNVTAVPVAGTPWINEFSYDSSATNDVGDEYVEVIVPAGYNVSNLSLALYNAGVTTNQVYRTDAFTNNTIVTSSALANGYTAYLFSYPAAGNIFQNGGPDGLAICNGTQPVQFLSYEGSFTGAGGCANGVTSTSVTVSQDNSTAPGTSLQLSGTGSKYADFIWNAPATNTKGAVNTGQTLN